MNKSFKIFIVAAIFFNLQFSTLNFIKAQDAEYNLIRREYTINGDGTIDIRYRKEIKLLRNRAITAYADKGETFILYNPAIDELTINESYTIRKDGSIVQTPSNAFIDQLPSQCIDCGRYNGIRERVVVHTALEYDCIIVLDYTIHRKTNYLDETITLSEDCPVKKYEIICDRSKIEAKGEYCWITFNKFDKKPKIKSAKGKWQLTAVNLPQCYKENNLPPSYSLYPNVHLQYGTPPVTEFYDELIPEAVNLLGELFDNDPFTYIKNIRDYVIDNIKTNDIPESLTGYTNSPAAITFTSGCGTPSDKQRLLSAMLRQAGFTNISESVYGSEVTINENGMGMTYIVSPRHKGELRLRDVAIDEQRTIEVTESIPWTGPSIGGLYKQMTLPTHPGSINIDPAQLASSRTAPLQVRNCNESYHYTILLPRTPKYLLVGKPIEIKRVENGVGSIYISIRQNEYGDILVTRELNIDVENQIVTAKQYKAFRRLMQDWFTYRTITIKAKM